MMTELLGECLLRFLFMKGKKKKSEEAEETLPEWILDEAQAFLKRINDDVEIYRKIRMINSLPASDEADGFSVWWDFHRYMDNPKSLGVLFDFYDEITNLVNNEGIIDGFVALQKKMILLYRHMKKNNFIGERI